jgi:DNA-binding transcriptional MerR regulator
MSRVNLNELSKLYYTIGEVADMFNVNPSLIRFWEKEFKLIQLKKNAKGNRLFTIKNIETFQRIHTLVKIQGYTLEGAKKVLKATKSKQDFTETFENAELINKLESIKEQLISLKRTLYEMT